MLRPVRRSALATLTVFVTAAIVSGQGGGEVPGAPARAKSAGILMLEPDGTLLVASGARINQKAGAVDRIGSFIVGLGGAAPDFDSAALSVMRFTPQGTLDVRFGQGGVAMTPLLPQRNRNRATVTAFLRDRAGRLVVVGWRDMSTALDSGLLAITAARYSASGVLDTGFGDRGIVTTRVNGAEVTQAFAAAIDGNDRLLVAGYSGGTDARGAGGSSDDWSVRSVLLRYTSSGVLDTSFADRGIASQALEPGGRDRDEGRDFLRYDYQHMKTAGLVIDRQGRAVLAVSNGSGPALLMRYLPDGRLDATFGNDGIARASAGAGLSISSLLQDADGRLLAVGTSASHMICLRYSADGVLDTTFGAGGISNVLMHSAAMRVSAALQDHDARLLAVASGEDGVLVARFAADGRPDASFGSGGVMQTARKWLATAAGLAVDAAGTPSVAAPGNDGIFLMRYDRERPADLSFRSAADPRPR